MNKQFVLAIAGGGQSVIGKITENGGMSNVLLEATCLQSTKATDNYIGKAPDKYVRMATARQLAVASYDRAKSYGDQELFGVGSTSCLVSEGEREGRRHFLYVCVHSSMYTWNIEIEFDKRTRKEQEDLVTNILHEVVKAARGLHPKDIREFLTSQDKIRSYSHHIQQYYAASIKIHTPYILCSSCNPIHDGHLNMIRHVGSANIELCTTNADKPNLDHSTIYERVEATQNKLVEQGIVGGVIVGDKGLFVDKSYLYPNSTFLVGGDTFNRILDPRFSRDGTSYDIRLQLEEIQANNCKFMIFPRPDHNVILDSIVPSSLYSIVEGYTLSSLSSSEIRKSNDQR